MSFRCISVMAVVLFHPCRLSFDLVAFNVLRGTGLVYRMFRKSHKVYCTPVVGFFSHAALFGLEL